ncbi:reverse transcriptase domain-containing protein [Tanacetum coccineum]
MFLQKSSHPAFVKAVEEICVTFGGRHPYHQCLATDGNAFLKYRDNIQGYVSAAAVNYNLGNTGYRPQSVANQIRPSGFAQPNLQNKQTRYNQGYNQNRGNNYNQGNPNYQAPIQQAQVGPSNDLLNYMKVNDANMRAMKNKISNMKKELRDDMSQQNQELKNMMTSFLQMNIASSSGSDSLPSNTVANPRGDLKAITTRSGVAYDGSPLPKEVERETEAIKDKVQPTAHIQPPVVQVPISEPDVALKPNPKLLILYPSRFNNQKLQLVECLALADLGASINLMPLSVWKKILLTKLTPTRMTLELANRSFAHPKGIAEDVIVKVGKFKFLADFVVLDYDVDPRAPLILGRPFLRTALTLIDVHGEELILRDGDEKLIFHADSTSKHPQKHAKESINMINFIDFTCEDCFDEVLKIKKSNHPLSGSTTPLSDSLPSLTSFETSNSLLEEFADELALLDPFPPGNEDVDFKADLREIKCLLNHDPLTDFSPMTTIDIINLNLERFTDEPALVFLPLPGNDDDEDDDEENTIPLNEIISQIPQSIAITPVLPTMEPKDSLIMGDENLSTIPEMETDKFIQSSVEEIIPILSESDDTSDNNRGYDLPFCDNSVTFSNPLFDFNDDFTSSDEESFPEEDVHFTIYSNPLFEFDDNYISSDVNPLFNEILEDIKSEDSSVSNFDESVLLNTPLSNEDECFDPRGDIDEIDAFLAI